MNHTKKCIATYEVDASNIDLAEALWKSEQQKLGVWKQMSAEAGLSRRKACYLLNIWRRLGPLDVDRALLVKVGWTKLSIIAKYSGLGEETEWLAFAQGSPAWELEEIMRSGESSRAFHGILRRMTDVFAHVLKFTPRSADGVRKMSRSRKILFLSVSSVLHQQAV